MRVPQIPLSLLFPLSKCGRRLRFRRHPLVLCRWKSSFRQSDSGKYKTSTVLDYIKRSNSVKEGRKFKRVIKIVPHKNPESAISDSLKYNRVTRI